MIVKLAGLALLLALLAAAAFVFWPGFGSFERWFAPKAVAWPRWEQHDAASQDTVDHSALTAFLGTYLRTEASGLNTVDYATVTLDDQSALVAYIEGIAARPVSAFNRDVQFAYWVNLYNAITIHLVLAHYPVTSIRDIKLSDRLFSIGPWDEKLVTVEGEALSLNDIEHRILRPIWRDPRIHYAVNCASVGCPNLAPSAYAETDLDAVLDNAARTYVNSDRGVTITGERISVSRIYDWFIADFGGTPEAVLAHLARYADDDLAANLARIGRLRGQHYDWRLNDPSP
ncbi:MAG: DUF547 domain-containing protein [Hyphomicrobiales bacterium]|nr:DUF547 domain-containing protein [Hyphomicrobiales bacterium]